MYYTVISGPQKAKICKSYEDAQNFAKGKSGSTVRSTQTREQAKMIIESADTTPFRFSKSEDLQIDDSLSNLISGLNSEKSEVVAIVNGQCGNGMLSYGMLLYLKDNSGIIRNRILSGQTTSFSMEGKQIKATGQSCHAFALLKMMKMATQKKIEKLTIVTNAETLVKIAIGHQKAQSQMTKAWEKEFKSYNSNLEVDFLMVTNKNKSWYMKHANALARKALVNEKNFDSCLYHYSFTSGTRKELGKLLSIDLQGIQKELKPRVFVDSKFIFKSEKTVFLSSTSERVFKSTLNHILAKGKFGDTASYDMKYNQPLDMSNAKIEKAQELFTLGFKVEQDDARYELMIETAVNALILEKSPYMISDIKMDYADYVHPAFLLMETTIGYALDKIGVEYPREKKSKGKKHKYQTNFVQFSKGRLKNENALNASDIERDYIERLYQKYVEIRHPQFTRA